MTGSGAGRGWAGLLAALLAAGAGGCASLDGGRGGRNGMDYLETSRRLAAQGAALERGSEAEKRAIERFQALLGDFKEPGFKARVREVYAHPFNAVVAILTIIVGLKHLQLGLQVVIEDYVHGHVAKFAALLANSFVTVLLGVAALYAILKMSFGL